jgi:type IV secretory pathway TraG/TraD family ATPase VirD4
MTNSSAWPPTYPHLSLIGVLGKSNQYAIVGAVIPIALSLAALRRARPKPRIAQPVRRAASALHGESNWFPTEQARRWFDKGGIVIGEAYRPDLNPKLAGKAPLLRYDGDAGSGHVLVFAGSGGYKTTGTVIPSALEWSSGLVCLDPAAEVLRLPYQLEGSVAPIPSTRSTESILSSDCALPGYRTWLHCWFHFPAALGGAR